MFDYRAYMLGISNPKSPGQLESGQSNVIAISSTPPLPETVHIRSPSLPYSLPDGPLWGLLRAPQP